MAKKSSSINLFRGKEKSFIEKFIDWALTFGRFVVIITEFVALTAFIYRFSLDRQLIDLHDRIKQKQTIVGLLKKDEDKYRNLQDRLALASTLSKKSIALQKTFTDIMSLVPSDLSLNAVTVSSKNIRIDANFLSLTSLTNFVNAIKKHPAISSVSLDKIENKTSTAMISVGITATLKDDANKRKY